MRIEPLAAVIASVLLVACGGDSLLNPAFAGTWTGTLTNNYFTDNGTPIGEGSADSAQLVVTVSGRSAQIVGVCTVGGSVTVVGSGDSATLSTTTTACQLPTPCGPGEFRIGSGLSADGGSPTYTTTFIYSSGTVSLANSQLTVELAGEDIVTCPATEGYPQSDVTMSFVGEQ